MKKLLLSFILLLTIQVAGAEAPWRVTEDTLPKFRKINMESFGKVPDADDIKQVDLILKGMEFYFMLESGKLVLKVVRTDIKDDGIIYILKQESGRILSGVTNGSTQPSIFLAELDEKKMLVWYRSPKEGFQIEQR